MRCFTRWVILVWACAGLTYSQQIPGAALQKLGEVDPHSLSHSNKGLGTVYSHAVLLPDSESELFLKDKLRSQAPGGGGGGAGKNKVPAATTGGQNEGLLVDTGFDGLALSDTPGYVPPDSQIAVGVNSGTLTSVEMVNGTIRITDTSAHDFYLCDLFFCDFFTAVISDPIVIYDPPSDRWFASVVTIQYVIQGALLKPVGQWRLAVSQGSDPMGAWNVYGVTMSDGTFPDFPKLGISSDKVVQTGDAFTVSTSRYKGTEFGVLSKQDVMDGVPTPGFQFFGPNQGGFAIASVRTSNSDLHMVALGGAGTSNSIRIWKLEGVPTTSGTGVTATVSNVSVATFATPPNAPQAGSTQLIDTNGPWLVGAAFDDNTQSMWVSGAGGCIPTGDTTARSCLRLVKLSLAGSPAVLQDITFGQPEKYFYYPAVSFDANGNLIAVFNMSSANDYIGVYAGGQVQASPGTFQNPVTLKAGETTYTITPPRWGDYSGASIDPRVGHTNVWLVGEYAQGAPGSDQWGTWVGSVHFP